MKQTREKHKCKKEKKTLTKCKLHMFPMFHLLQKHVEGKVPSKRANLEFQVG
jgi:hypothetical protein